MPSHMMKHSTGTMLFWRTTLTFLSFLLSTTAFSPLPQSHVARHHALLRPVTAKQDDEVSADDDDDKYDDGDSALAKVAALFGSSPEPEEEYNGKITSIFPRALTNKELTTHVVRVLDDRGYTAKNTLLATSLCCDELARQLEDDFNKIYGSNFNLGGLSGFPFAGTTGFGAMSAHIPDDGSCLIVYGPHVGVATTGEVGKVERRGIALVDTCCGSAVAASNYVKSIVEGEMPISSKIQQFTDFQQGAVQELILPHGRRLSNADDTMVELPYCIYDSQDLLMGDIVQKGAGGVKNNIALLGGIQINTAPDTLDYFLPLRFDYMNNKGEVIEDLLPLILEEE